MQWEIALVILTVAASRKLPLRNRVKEKLDDMVAQLQIGFMLMLIFPISNSDLCICMDPRSWNVYIKMETFHIPT